MVIYAEKSKIILMQNRIYAGPSKVFEVGVYSLEDRRLPKGVVASRLCHDEGKIGVNCLACLLLKGLIYVIFNVFRKIKLAMLFKKTQKKQVNGWTYRCDEATDNNRQ